MSGMSGIPCRARPKNGRAGKKGPRVGEKKRGKIRHLKKKVFCRLEKQNFGWKKKFSVEKKMSVGEFPLPKTDMSGMSGIPCYARPENGRGGPKRPRAYRGEKKKKKSSSFGKKSFLSVGKIKCWLGKNIVG